MAFATLLVAIYEFNSNRDVTRKGFLLNKHHSPLISKCTQDMLDILAYVVCGRVELIATSSY